jgi:hypothetical protein
VVDCQHAKEKADEAEEGRRQEDRTEEKGGAEKRGFQEVLSRKKKEDITKEKASTE